MGFLDFFRRRPTEQTAPGDPGRLTTPNEPAAPTEVDADSLDTPGQADSSRTLREGGAEDREPR